MQAVNINFYSAFMDEMKCKSGKENEYQFKFAYNLKLSILSSFMVSSLHLRFVYLFVWLSLSLFQRMNVLYIGCGVVIFCH